LKSHKIKFGDYYMFSFLPDSNLFLEYSVMYGWEPFCYSQHTRDDNDCIKWKVVRSKLMEIMYPKKDER